MKIGNMTIRSNEDTSKQYEWAKDITKPISITGEIKDKKTIKYIHDLIESIKWQQAIWKYYYFNIKRW